MWRHPKPPGTSRRLAETTPQQTGAKSVAPKPMATNTRPQARARKPMASNPHPHLHPKPLLPKPLLTQQLLVPELLARGTACSTTPDTTPRASNRMPVVAG